MQVSVLIERVNGSGYLARTGAPFDLAAEGATRMEAVDRLRAEIGRMAERGAEVVSIEVPATGNPWLRLDGIDKDDPQFEQLIRAMEENRRRADADPDVR